VDLTRVMRVWWADACGVLLLFFNAWIALTSPQHTIPTQHLSYWCLEYPWLEPLGAQPFDTIMGLVEADLGPGVCMFRNLVVRCHMPD
jgi:hypothetical protein